MSRTIDIKVKWIISSSLRDLSQYGESLWSFGDANSQTVYSIHNADDVIVIIMRRFWL